MFLECPRCRTKIEKEMKFCPKCGARLKEPDWTHAYIQDPTKDKVNFVDSEQVKRWRRNKQRQRYAPK